MYLKRQHFLISCSLSTQMLLFLLEKSCSNVFIYADDTNIAFASNNVEEKNKCMNSDLEEIPEG